jgi:TetR/AcrR family transcriptional regulator, cholesterol catabolism regulator
MQDISAKIIETAGYLFRKYGVKSISMDDIARELSISKKTIYQFFKDKNEIVCLTTSKYLSHQKEKFDKIQQESDNAIEKLHKATLFAREIFEKINPYILYDIKKYYKDAWELYLDHEKNVMYESLISTLREGIREGLFRPDINVEVLATLRMEEVKLAFDRDIFPEEEFNFQEVQYQILDHFFYGIITEVGYALLNKYKKIAVTNDQF